MPTVAIAFPIVPGKEDAGRQFAAEVSGPRRAEQVENLKQEGITREEWYLQTTPHGLLFIVVIDSDDPWASLATFQTASSSYQFWFIDRVLEITGIDMRVPLPGPISQQVFAWKG